jgi:hypothetical protein
MHRTVAPGSHVIADGWSGYGVAVSKNYDQEKVLQSKAEDRSKTLPGVHLVSSLVKRRI